MDQTLVNAKTPIGDEAVRQSTRVVQRNLRMLLVQVDGKLSVAELAAKLGDAEMVERALQELEEGGYIAPILEAVPAWQQSKLRLAGVQAADASSVASPESGMAGASLVHSASSNFSSFGKPILPARGESVPPEPPKKSTIDERDFRPRRSYRPLVLGALAVVLVLVIVSVLFFPYARFKPGIEAELARIWRVPVSVGNVELKLLPKPALLVSDVRIGNDGESQIAKIRIFEPQALLGSGTHSLARVEVSGGKLAVAHVMGLSEASRDGGASQRGTVLNAVAADGLSIVAGKLVLGEFAGEFGFAGDGRLEKGALQTRDGGLRVAAQAATEGVALTLEGSAWRPSEDSALTLDSLKAKGMLQRDKLVIESFDASALGGVLKGSWLVDWRNGLAMAGDAALTRLDARKAAVHFAPSLLLDGELTANLRLRGVGANWQGMWANLEATLDGRVMRGALNGVDLGEAARRGPGAPVRAGTTRFDRLTLTMTIDPRQVVGREVQLIAGPFSASGQFAVTRDRQVDAALSVTLSGSAGSRTVPIRISGTLPNLQAVALR